MNKNKVGRKKSNHKNISVSISLPEDQIVFINKYKDFNLSKFVQVCLYEHMNNVYSIDNIDN